MRTTRHRAAHPLGSPALTAFGPVGMLPAAPDAPPVVEPPPRGPCTCRAGIIITCWGAGCVRCGRPRAVRTHADVARLYRRA